MKIIQIIPSLELAGAEIMCENLVYSLRNIGADVVVVSLYDCRSPITERLEKAGADIRYLHKKRGLDLSMIGRLRKLFKKEQPDAIHTHMYTMKYAIPAAILAGVKRRVHTLHSVASKENKKSARKLNKLFYKFAGVTPVALSAAVQETVVEEYRLPKEQIPIVFNGIDLTRCHPKTEYSYKETFKILHIGRFADVKNQKMLISAFAAFHSKHPDSVLWLIGDGELRAECEALAKHCEIAHAVQFLGMQSNVYGFLHDADVFTLPSIYEGIPMTLIEAMGTALPIVASNVGGIPDMLQNGKSALLTEVDANVLTQAFENLYSDEHLRKRLGENALAASVQFSSEEMAKKYVEIYVRKNRT